MQRDGDAVGRDVDPLDQQLQDALAPQQDQQTFVAEATALSRELVQPAAELIIVGSPSARRPGDGLPPRAARQRFWGAPSECRQNADDLLCAEPARAHRPSPSSHELQLKPGTLLRPASLIASRAACQTKVITLGFALSGLDRQGTMGRAREPECRDGQLGRCAVRCRSKSGHADERTSGGWLWRGRTLSSARGIKHARRPAPAARD